MTRFCWMFLGLLIFPFALITQDEDALNFHSISTGFYKAQGTKLEEGIALDVAIAMRWSHHIF